jgi:bacillithiol system protein YtxJ
MFKNPFIREVMNSNDIVTRIPLTEEKQLERMLEVSYDEKVLIFKHSSRCGISSMVLKRFEKALKLENNVFNYYFLDIIKYRELSNAIADSFQIRHESPQLLVVKNGKVIADDSHYGILEMKYSV